jgi:hypothetical protein
VYCLEWERAKKQNQAILERADLQQIQTCSSFAALGEAIANLSAKSEDEYVASQLQLLSRTIAHIQGFLSMLKTPQKEPLDAGFIWGLLFLITKVWYCHRWDKS